MAVRAGVGLAFGVPEITRCIVRSITSPTLAAMRAMALSDHCRCVPTPRGSRTSRNVTSGRQRWTNQCRTWTASRAGPGRVGAEQGLRVEAALVGVAHQNPADRDGRHPTVAPDGGVGADLDGALALAIPARHGHAPPGRGRAGQHRGQGGQALAGAQPFLTCQAGDAKDARNRAPARSQDGARQQRGGVSWPGHASNAPTRSATRHTSELAEVGLGVPAPAHSAAASDRAARAAAGRSASAM